MPRYDAAAHTHTNLYTAADVYQYSDTNGSADGNRFAWAEIYAEAARIPGVDAVALRADALRFYDSIIKPSDFHDQRGTCQRF